MRLIIFLLMFVGFLVNGVALFLYASQTSTDGVAVNERLNRYGDMLEQQNRNIDGMIDTTKSLTSATKSNTESIVILTDMANGVARPLK